jgi:hypothetical protein
MGITERERRVEVFFYGLFMDEELLRGKGLEPESGEIAAIDGFALRIGQLVASPSGRSSPVPAKNTVLIDPVEFSSPSR